MAGAASFTIGCWPDRMYRKRYGDTPTTASSSATAAKPPAPAVSAKKPATAKQSAPTIRSVTLPSPVPMSSAQRPAIAASLAHS